MAKNEVFCHFTKTLYVYIYIIRAYLNWTRKFSPLSFPFWEHGIGASFILVEFLVDLVLPSSPFLFNAFSFQNKWSRPACKLLFDIFVMGFSLSFKWWKESVVTENWTMLDDLVSSSKEILRFFNGLYGRSNEVLWRG